MTVLSALTHIIRMVKTSSLLTNTKKSFEENKVNNLSEQEIKDFDDIGFFYFAIR